ncbi:hypothetical protein F2Q70_00010053 [Brassica cretica]|uniref:A-kinase anchor protein 7-like phosphoesterase domain-containing protein n=1 Tax=Brassica cretica TaxID=69181 RepID=A0A8S9M8L3_BRACR|nr:hypothetical protein F2Q70_00010053 [Brassica cretica]
MIDAFVPDKLAAEKAKSRLKLHLTMMSKGETFDAREIQRVFREKDWDSGCPTLGDLQTNKTIYVKTVISGSLSNLNHVYNKEHSRGEKQLCMNNLSKAYFRIDRVVGFTSSCLKSKQSIFIKPSTFHLTVLMLKLWNKDRFNTARDVLKSISPSVMDALDNQPIFIRLKGLDCMRGSLAKARVLYIPVEEIGDEGRLLQVITDAFVKAGLVLEKDANQSLKLHATVMNARHRKRKKMDSFDAREIHKQFGNEDWGEYLIQEAHLSQRFVFDQSGYYHCCASIPFENTETEKKH